MSKKQRYSDNCIIVIDVEATCWGTGSSPVAGATIVDPVSEIIEIGYAILNYKTNEITQTGSIVVRPEESTVSKFCTDLTGWTQEAVDRGISLKEACDTLKQNLASKSRLWASFGEYDKTMFANLCARRGIEYPWTKQHLNVKAVAAVLNGEVSGTGRALSLCGLSFEGRQHSGKDDAYNTARILQHYKTKFGVNPLA